MATAENHQKRRYVRRITLIRPDADDVSLVTDLLDSAIVSGARICWITI
jgi:hypothetical protein